MDIVINTAAILEYLSKPPLELVWNLFWLIGWLPISLVMLWGFFEMWVLYRQDQWTAKQKFVLLAIDIPKGNEQSPKAVENLFAYIAGAHSSLNLIDMYWEGKYQLSFSFEIASIEGYTQFLIRTPEQFKNLTESAVYAQYPDAEITEVNDYTPGIPTKYPDEQYDVWGAEFIQAANPAYPIKTYKDFEHQMGEPSTHFRDPMASLMDLCSTIGPGEQLWYQLIVWPIGFEWPEIGEKEVKKILKEVPKPKVTMLNKLVDSMTSTLDVITGFSLTAPPAEKKQDDSLKMMNLKPREKRQVEAIHEKISKLGFKFKIRMVYVAKKDVMNKNKVVNGFVGYMKQYVYNDLNNLKPDMSVTATSTEYLFTKMRLNERKSKIVRYYMGRSSKGRDKGLMNTEELASIWHFPFESVVKAPLIGKTPGRKAEPPMSLPVQEEASASDIMMDSIFTEVKETKPHASPVEEEDIFSQKTNEETIKSLPNQPTTNELNKKNAPPDNLPFA
ncbi:MAG: hypothetical protein UT48_C0018G0020 [Parcubacteria group bacterium GW2011_GWE2_39_37]|nr:MAG: hypothetical protein UT48_C0018G0020 [Parcubacteria group bacterium GW2011_GWE2_39_37]